MGFANPAALWLLALALVVLLARRRRPTRRVAVAALHLWDAPSAHDTSPLARRFRTHWLLLLQAAVIVAVVLAIARPLWTFRGGSAALVLDTSMSMSARAGGITRLDTARQRAEAWIDALPAGMRVRLITASPAPRVIGEFVAADAGLRRALAGLRATDAGADVGAAVDYARAADPRPERVLVVTDAAAPAGERRAEWIRVGQPAENVALTVLSAKRTSTGAGDVDVLAELHNHGRTQVTTTLTLTQEGATVSRQPVVIAPHGRARVVAVLHDITGVVTAHVETDDAIAADNTRRTVIASAPVTRVALSGGSYFVERALRSRPGVVFAAPPLAGAAATADVLVCSGCSEVPRDGSSTGVLLILPKPAATTEPAAAAPITQSSEPHPVTRSLELAGIAATIIPGAFPSVFPGANPGGNPGTQAPAGATIVASAGGAPAILAYESAGRRVVELRVDLERSALPLTPAFPILIANAIDWLASRERRPTDYTAGDPIVRPVPPATADTAARAITVTGPRQETLATVTDGHLVTVTSSAAAGTYRLRAGALDDSFVVNPATGGESDVSATSSTTAEATAGSTTGSSPSSTTISTSGGTNSGGPAESTPRRDRRVDMAAAVLAVALALLAAEWRLRAPRSGARHAGAGGRA